MAETAATADRFTTTRWSVVLACADSQIESVAARDALAELCRTYWRPIFAYICRHARPRYVVDLDPETNRVIVGDAEDLIVDEFEIDNVNWHPAGEAIEDRPLPASPLSEGEGTEVRGFHRVALKRSNPHPTLSLRKGEATKHRSMLLLAGPRPSKRQLRSVITIPGRMLQSPHWRTIAPAFIYMRHSAQ